MRIVLQRVSSARVSVDGEERARIDRGLLVLVGAGKRDGDAEPERLAAKVASLRIFNDGDGKMNLSLGDVGGAVLVVPNFTLYGDVRKGRRPSWNEAADPEEAAARVERFAAALEAEEIDVARGVFGAHMHVELVNDGPVTLTLEGSDLV